MQQCVYAVSAVAVVLGVLGLLTATPTPNPELYRAQLLHFEAHYAEQHRRAAAGRATSVSPLADSYAPVAINAPILTGAPMKIFAAVLKLPVLGDALSQKLKRDNGYWKLQAFAAAISDTTPMFYPHRQYIVRVDANTSSRGSLPGSRNKGLVRSLHEQFVSAQLSPIQHVEETLRRIEQSDDAQIALRAVIDVDAAGARAAAAESAKRYAAGKPLSILDGVAVVIKTEIAAKGLKHTLGTAILGSRIASEDSIPVAKLRALGAIIVGVTSMHELGLGTTGFNAHTGSPRNPHNYKFHTGGSSGGSGAAVAAGIVPLAIGADGGGSIRIPAAHCGIVGLKATFGRVPAATEIDYTVGHVGPMATTIDDVEIGLEAIAATQAESDCEFSQPELSAWMASPAARALATKATEALPLKGLRVGVYRRFSNDSSPEQARATERAERRLLELGATIVDVEIPFLDVMFAAHTVSILSEISTSVDRYRSRFGEFSYPVQITLRAAEMLTNAEYLAGQMARRWFYDYATKTLFERSVGCDVMLTPATGRTPPLIPADRDGEINLHDTAAIMRFATFANLVGVPALVVPMGKTTIEDQKELGLEPGLPIGVQLMAAPWQEGLLLHVGRFLEQ